MEVESSSGSSILTRRRLMHLAVTGATLAGGAALLSACGASATPASATSSTTSSAATKAALAATPTPLPGKPTPTPLPTPAALAKGSGSKPILMWHNYTQKGYTALTQSIDDFVAKYPEYKVNAEYVPTSSGSQENEKLITAIAGGKPPDVAQFDRFIVGSFAFRGALNDLSSMAAQAKITQDQYLPFAWDEASLDGKLYALPIDTDARALYYNKTMFDQAGIKPPTTPQELDAAAAKLTIKSGTGYKRLGFIPTMDQGFLYTWGWVWGGHFYDKTTKHVTANDPKIVEALTWMTSYAKKYGEEQMVSFQSAFGQGAQSPFIAGLVAMDPNGSWQIAQIKQYGPSLQFGVIPFPHPAGVKDTTWSGGWSWTVPKGSKHVADGFLLASFITNETEMTKFCQAITNFPVRVAALKNAAFQTGEYKIFADLLPVSHNRPVIPEGNMLWNDLATATSNAMYGKVTPKAALDQVTTQVNDQLKKDKWF
ncbi:MAG: ABC transporter substrate-binding protein [Chloroflexi bacterium]|nr:ABC transporter substrate-binding protein [Chloroflexota bacterium]